MKRTEILVADNGSELAEIVNKEFGGAYRVTVVRSREDAVREAAVADPDLVVIGFLAPRGESFELQRELRQDSATGRIPLLAVDVAASERKRKGWRRWEAMQMEADEYLTQPLDAGDLRHAVVGMVERAKSRKRRRETALAKLVIWQSMCGKRSKLVACV